MISPETKSEVRDMLFREALCLDEQRWDDWLGLYTDDVEFWAPAWKSEHELTSDPKSEISLIYAGSRLRLEERINRLRSGSSAAALVLPRTAHAISNILIDHDGSEEFLKVRCLCITHIYDPKRRNEHRIIARYEVRLVRADADWRICGKKIIVLNDNLPAKLEFYMM